MAHRPHRYQGKPRRRRFDPPFDVMQPLERYRLHHGMRLRAFVAYLGVTEETYLELLVGDEEIPVATKEQIGRRLRVPRWLVTECAAPPPKELQDLLAAAITEDDGTYYLRDEDTGEFGGPFVEEREWLPPERDVPRQELALATAITRLNGAHQDRQDADYPRVLALLKQRIRAYLALGSDEALNAESWAEQVFFASVPRIRQIGSEREALNDE